MRAPPWLGKTEQASAKIGKRVLMGQQKWDFMLSVMIGIHVRRGAAVACAPRVEGNMADGARPWLTPPPPPPPPPPPRASPRTAAREGCAATQSAIEGIAPPTGSVFRPGTHARFCALGRAGIGAHLRTRAHDRGGGRLG